ncbi:hypothetical protein G3O08_05620 [Cryomorpha ignava]|uniref:Mur ligase C-terminal domain-containing protein n=1 Tax=Cryomorpha ignava TaxID=101383 RepID=A0A7K3WMV4_9FLAO|nr:hypothetical protein [Cryomorpha ignava]NEN22977.1 hypothetical protein [Cryomorpha ignava]
MKGKKSYTIHKSKKSQTDKTLSASDNLRRNLERTTYRVDSVVIVKDVEFVCDSRSADLLSTRDSFKFLEKPIIWISGKAKHERDYSLIEAYLNNKIKGVVIYGVNGEETSAVLNKFVKGVKVKETLVEAVNAAYKMAEKGDVVLYSPSCAVKDEYLNYVDRGLEFIRIVKDLK